MAGIYIDAYGQIEAILLCFYCSSINTNVKWNNGEEEYEMCGIFASLMHFKKIIFFQCSFITCTTKTIALLKILSSKEICFEKINSRLFKKRNFSHIAIMNQNELFGTTVILVYSC